VSDALAGTAIAVALMPPLCVVGLSLSQGLWQYSWGAFLLYTAVSSAMQYILIPLNPPIEGGLSLSPPSIRGLGGI
jgi:uncharacterized membrane protein